MPELSLTGLAIFFIMLLASVGFISNISPASQKNIQDQMYMINCPMPIFDGTVDGGSVIFTSYFSFNYTVTYSGSPSVNNTGTFFRCYLDFLSTDHPAVSIIEKDYQETFLTIPYGWIGYIGDILNVAFQRIFAFFTLVTYYITPINFSFLGYTISDISATALIFVITIYAIGYITIGAWIYKILSPFSTVA